MFTNTKFVTYIYTKSRAKNKVELRHHPTTLKSSLRASRISYSFFQGDLGKKSYEVSKLGGGGGEGGGSWAKKIF